MSKNSSQNTIRVSNSLDPVQADILSGLIWVQAVCKINQQTTQVGIIKLFGHCIATWYALSQSLVKLMEIGTGNTVIE